MNDDLPPLPEPAAWMIRNLVDTEVQPWPTRPDSEAYALASVHQGYECSPLYTADQLRAAVLAERERFRAAAEEARRVLSMPLLMKGDAPVVKALKMLDEALGTQDEGKT